MSHFSGNIAFKKHGVFLSKSVMVLVRISMKIYCIKET